MVAWLDCGQGYWILEEQKLDNGSENLLHYPDGGTITKAMHDEIFIPTYSKFLAAQGTERRKMFLAEHIVNVWWDREDKTVNVKFDNGDWWHFTRNGDWY